MLSVQISLKKRISRPSSANPEVFKFEHLAAASSANPEVLKFERLAAACRDCINSRRGSAGRYTVFCWQKWCILPWASFDRPRKPLTVTSGKTSVVTSEKTSLITSTETSFMTSRRMRVFDRPERHRQWRPKLHHFYVQQDIGNCIQKDIIWSSKRTSLMTSKQMLFDVHKGIIWLSKRHR